MFGISRSFIRKSFPPKYLYNNLRKFSYFNLQRDINCKATILGKKQNNLCCKKYFSSAKDKKNDDEDDDDIPEEIDLTLIELQFDEILDDLSDQFDKIHFGYLSPSIFDDVEFRAYGQSVGIEEVAQLVPQNETTIFFNIYDPSIINDIKQVS